MHSSLEAGSDWFCSGPRHTPPLVRWSMHILTDSFTEETPRRLCTEVVRVVELIETIYTGGAVDEAGSTQNAVASHPARIRAEIDIRDIPPAGRSCMGDSMKGGI